MDTQPRKVIVDTDPGFDDYWAILMLIFAQKMGLVQIEAITCTAGNADLENVCRNTVRVLELAGATDIPVYKGTPPKRNASQVGYFLHDGFGDLTDIYQPEDLSYVIRNKTAEQAISEIVAQNPNDISLICLGPLTYIASVIKSNPTFKQQVKDVWIMGGNDPDNQKYPKRPEYNFYCDPESADFVLNSLTCPTYLVPFQTSLDIYIPLAWRYAVLDFKSPTISLTTEVEKKINTYRNETIFNLPDAYVTFAFFNFTENVKKFDRVHITVEKNHSDKRGLVTFSKNSEPKINVVKDIDVEGYKRLMVNVARFF